MRSLKWKWQSYSSVESSCECGSIPPFGMKTSGSASIRLQIQETQVFKWITRVNIECCRSISTPWLLEPWILAVREIAPYTECWVQTVSWKTLPQPCKVLPPSYICNWVFKRPFNHQVSNFRMVGNMVNPVVCEHECITALHLLWIPWLEAVLCGIPWWWIRHSRSLQKQYMHGKQIHVCVQSKNKALSLPWWKQPSVVNLPPGSWPVIPGKGAGPRRWSLLLADCTLSSGCSQLGLGEWKLCCWAHA